MNEINQVNLTTLTKAVLYKALSELVKLLIKGSLFVDKHEIELAKKTSGSESEGISRISTLIRNALNDEISYYDLRLSNN